MSAFVLTLAVGASLYPFRLFLHEFTRINWGIREIPLVTAAAIEHASGIWWIAIIASLIQLQMLIGLFIFRSRMFQTAFWIAAAITFLFLAGVAVALYLPVMQMGAPV